MRVVRWLRMCRVVFSRGIRYGSQWSLRLHLGLGAGYIGGSTIYLAKNCHSPRCQRYHEGPKLIQMGWTRNAGEVPFTNH